jgi:hypothetical protein
MGRRIVMAAHASADELAAQYRAARDPVERSQRQIIWLLACGRSRAEVAAVTGYSARWVSTVLARYNAAGPAGLGDRRHANAGGTPLLDEQARVALDAALETPPPDGGLWTGRQVAAWIANRTISCAPAIADGCRARGTRRAPIRRPRSQISERRS